MCQTILQGGLQAVFQNLSEGEWGQTSLAGNPAVKGIFGTFVVWVVSCKKQTRVVKTSLKDCATGLGFLKPNGFNGDCKILYI